MSLFDYSRTKAIEEEKSHEEVMNHEVSEPVSSVESDMSSLVSSSSAIINAPSSLEEDFSSASEIQDVDGVVRLHRVDNEDIYIDEAGATNVRLVRIPDKESSDGYGVMMLDKSCIEPSVGSNGGLQAGFSDVVISTDGKSLMGHYFRFDGYGDARKTVHVDISPKELCETWNNAEMDRMTLMRQSQEIMVNSMNMEEEMQYGTE